MYTSLYAHTYKKIAHVELKSQLKFDNHYHHHHRHPSHSCPRHTKFWAEIEAEQSC
jgi:hypothetical protein